MAEFRRLTPEIIEELEGVATPVSTGASSVFWSPTGEVVPYDWKAVGDVAGKLFEGESTHPTELPNKSEGNDHKVIAQDWDKYDDDEDHYDLSPETFTSYHLSLGQLGLYAAQLEEVNNRGFRIYEINGVAHEATVDGVTYRRIVEHGIATTEFDR